MESIGEAAAEMARGGQPAPARPALHTARALHAAMRRVARRVRLQRALDAGVAAALPAFALIAFAFALIATGLIATRDVAPRATHWLLGFAGLACCSGLLYGALRRVAPLFVARAIDRSLATPDLVSSAWQFLGLPVPSRTPFMRACIDQALRASERVDPRQAFALRRPRLLYAATAALLVAVLLSRIAPPVAPVPVVVAQHKPRLLEQDDVRLWKDELRALQIDTRADAQPDVRDAARELNALLEALADRQLDRAEALRALRGLEQRLQNAQQTQDDVALREALRELGRALAKDSPLAQDLAAALDTADAEKARAELERLAARVAEESPRTDAARRLQRALQRAAQSPAAEARERADKARDDLKRAEKARDETNSLLRRKQPDAAQDEREQRLLRDKRRELDKLERDAEQKAAGARQLEQLRRELSSSAQSLAGGKSDAAAQQLKDGAKALQDAQRSQLSEQQRKELRERVQQLREQISKQRQQGQQAGAQGERNGHGQSQQQQQQQQSGQVQRLDLQQFSKAARGGAQGEPGGSGSNGDKSDKPQRLMLMPGQHGDANGPQVLMPGDGDGQHASQMLLQQQDSAGGPSPGQNGPPPGTQSPTQLSSSRIDTRVEGREGQGPSRSDVIREAGQRGFVARDYQSVHGEYERHAEAVVERDHVPPGYRFYVRRYFQLIRPREETR